jgi:hypothetical protein
VRVTFHSWLDIRCVDGFVDAKRFSPKIIASHVCSRMNSWLLLLTAHILQPCQRDMSPLRCNVRPPHHTTRSPRTPLASCILPHKADWLPLRPFLEISGVCVLLLDQCGLCRAEHASYSRLDPILARLVNKGVVVANYFTASSHATASELPSIRICCQHHLGRK